jgi:hypothetical protein
MSVSEREITKRYIKEGLQGYVRDDGIHVPGARRIFTGLSSENGYDLRHIERWSSAKLATARKRIQALNTLTSRSFAVVTPRNARQRKSAQSFTGQNLSYQKSFIVQIQTDRDKPVFRKNKLAIERKLPSGSKIIQTRFLFRDYLTPAQRRRKRVELYGEEDSDEETDDPESRFSEPSTFREMRTITLRVLPDMPSKIYGRDAFYTLLTAQYGPIGRSVVKSRILELLTEYFQRYDPGGTLYQGHKDFAEQVIGFQMVGTFAQASAYEIDRDRRSREARQRRKLRFRRRR